LITVAVIAVLSAIALPTYREHVRKSRIAKSYAMPLFCVAPTGSTLAGGGLPPTPVAGIVSIGTGETARRVIFVIGAPNPKRSGIEGSRVNPVIKVPRSRIYWYQEVNR
jgi:type IV pilus assembly protein PilY1